VPAAWERRPVLEGQAGRESRCRNELTADSDSTVARLEEGSGAPADACPLQ